MIRRIIDSLVMLAAIGLVVGLIWIFSERQREHMRIKSEADMPYPGKATGPSLAEAIRGVRTTTAPNGQDPAEAIDEDFLK